MNKRIIWMILLFFAVGALYVTSDRIARAMAPNQGNQQSRSPLPLPTTFQDEWEINQDILAGVKDWTILDNDQRRWDRGFWQCLDAVLNLSPEEISKRAHEIDFSNMDDASPEDQAFRNGMRGQFIRVKGKYIPDTSVKYVQLPHDNPTGRQRMQLGVVVAKEVPDALRVNVPEAWLVYSLDDSVSKRNDIVEFEGCFLKLLKYKSREDETRTLYLPLLVAQSPKVLKAAVIPQLIKKKGNPTVVKWLGALTLIGGFLLIVWTAYKQRERSKFKNDVLKKIKAKRERQGDSN